MLKRYLLGSLFGVSLFGSNGLSDGGAVGSNLFGSNLFGSNGLFSALGSLFGFRSIVASCESEHTGNGQAEHNFFHCFVF